MGLIIKSTDNNKIKIKGYPFELEEVFCKVQFAFTPSNNTIFRFVFGNNTITAGAVSRVWKGTELRYKHLES